MPPRVPAGEAASAPYRAQMEIFVRVSSLRLAVMLICCVELTSVALMLSVMLLEVGREPVQSQTTSLIPLVVKTGTAVSFAPLM